MAKSVRTTAVVFLLSFVLSIGISPVHASFYDDLFGGSTVKSTSQKAGTAPAKPTPAPSSVAKASKSSGPSTLSKFIGSASKALASVGDALWPFDEGVSQKSDSKGVQAQVLGASDSKGPSIFSKIFGFFGSVADALWPFDGDDGAKAQKTDTQKAESSPAPSATPAPEELASTGDLEVAEAADSSNVSVVLANELDELTVKDKLTVGDDSSDRLILKALLASDLLVDTTKTYNIGSGGGRFKDGYFSGNLYVGEENRIGATGMNVKGSAYIETRSGGSIYLIPDSQNVYIGTESQTGHLTVHNNLIVRGTLSTTSGAGLTPDSIDITPATNIDALDIIGTNITTASLIDLDATASTSGNVVDIDVTGAATGHAIAIDNIGDAVWTGDMINLTSGTGDVTGDFIDMTFEAGATDLQGIVVANAAASDQAGWFMNIGASGTYTSDVISFDNTGNTATSGDFIALTTGTGDADGDVMDITVELGATSTQIFDVNNAAVSDEAGWLLEVDTTGAWTGNMIDIALGAQASEGNIINVSMGSTNVAGGAFVIADAGGARTDALIDITTASTGSAADAAAIFQINSTGDLADLANVIDINMSGGTGANVIDITTLTAASSGNLIDLNFGVITDTGDAINIALGATATGSQALVVTSGAMTRTTDLFSITDSGTSSGDTVEIALTGATTGHGIFLNNDAMVATGNVLYIDSDADRSSTSLFVIDDIADDTASAPTIDINLTAASDQPIINVDTAASNGSVIDLNHTLADVTVQTYLMRGTYTDTADAEADFLLFEDAGGTAQFLIAEDGNTTITGTGDGTAALTLTTGDLVVSDGDLTVSGGDVNFTTDAGDTLNIAKGAAPTADVVLIAGGSPTTTNVDALAITLTTTDQTDITNSLMNLVLTSGGTASTDIARGIFIDLASTAGGNDTAIEIENTAAWDVDIALQFDETISNVNDDALVLTGVGGTNNTSVTFDLDGASGTNVPAIVSGGSDLVTVFDSLSVGINGETTENIASSDFAFGSGNDLYVDDKLGVNGTASIDGNLWQGDAVTTTTKTTAFLFLGTTAGAPTGDPATPAGFAAIVFDTTNNKLCAEEEAAGAAWICSAALADIAEWMPAAGAESGDLVSITNLANPTEDPTAPYMLAKTTKPYDNKLVGVVSKYAEDAESAQGYKLSADYHAVTLVGRVPVKISGEGGAVAKGDYLTSASTPGYAMKATKAGPVAGMALESFSGDKGTIMLFVKAAWFDPVEEQKRAVLAALGLGGGSVLGASTTAGTPDSEGTTATSSLVGAAADGSLGVLEESVDLLVHGLLTANNLRVTTAAEFGGTLVVKGLATFEGDLVVKGALSLGSLDIGGALTKTMTAGSDISAGDPVAVSGANTVVKAGAGANVVGLAAHSAGAGSSVRVAVAGTVGGYSGLSAGARYYVGAGGSVTTSPGAASAVHVGIAISGSEMIVQIFKASVEPAAVEDVATVDPGPTVTVDEGSTPPSGGSETPAASPEPTPTSAEATVGEPEPTVEPSATPEPSPAPAL